MSGYIAKKIKELRIKNGLSQQNVADLLQISERKLRSIESNEHPITINDVLTIAKLYKVDVRELILENYTDNSKEQILCNRYSAFLELYDQLPDKEKEDIYWVVRQRVNNLI